METERIIQSEKIESETINEIKQDNMKLIRLLKDQYEIIDSLHKHCVNLSLRNNVLTELLRESEQDLHLERTLNITWKDFFEKVKKREELTEAIIHQLHGIIIDNETKDTVDDYDDSEE